MPVFIPKTEAAVQYCLAGRFFSVEKGRFHDRKSGRGVRCFPFAPTSSIGTGRKRHGCIYPLPPWRKRPLHTLCNQVSSDKFGVSWRLDYLCTAEKKKGCNMFCTHRRNHYGCTSKFCRYDITVILMIVSFFLSVHILFPHHHHFYNAFCKQKQGHESCEVEIEKALVRTGTPRYGQHPASSVGENLVPSVLPLFVTDSFRFDFLQEAGSILLFPLFTFRRVAPIFLGTHSLRAPPSVSL